MSGATAGLPIATSTSCTAWTIPMSRSVRRTASVGATADFPARTNVEFVAVRSRTELEQRTWERGTGETLACGSGACAVATAAILGGHTDRDVRIRLRGGELQVRWPDSDGPIWLAGPTEHVFDGEIAL